jgi:hypothetical protein
MRQHFRAISLIAAFVAAPAFAAPTTCGNVEGSGKVAEIAAAVGKLAPLLGDAQRAKLLRPLTRESAITWSNLPVAIVPRLGLRLGDLDEKQAAAVRVLLATALSGCGLTLLDEVRLADDFLKPHDKRQIGWDGANYYLSVLGTPSAKDPWMLQLGGHHLAYNFTFNGRLPGATPLFLGSEPITFEMQGKQHAPLSRQSEAMSALAIALSARPQAKLAGTFTDVVKGVVVTPGAAGGPPTGGTDTGFPQQYATGTNDRGVKVSTLSPEERALVRTAIESYAQLPGKAIARAALDSYLTEAALNDAYVGFAGSPDFSTAGSYVRIDGPRVWIEIITQRAIAFPEQLHFHSLWRDKQSDYGGEVGGH